MVKSNRSDKNITIIWQRLLTKEKTTCDRCGNTEKELEKAVKKLQKLGIAVTLRKKALSFAQFKAAPLESNRIIINRKPLEYWLKAGTGSSPCCAECGDCDCRTVEVSGQRYETIPAKLIVQAAVEACGKKGDEGP